MISGLKRKAFRLMIVVMAKLDPLSVFQNLLNLQVARRAATKADHCWNRYAAWLVARSQFFRGQFQSAVSALRQGINEAVKQKLSLAVAILAMRRAGPASTDAKSTQADIPPRSGAVTHEQRLLKFVCRPLPCHIWPDQLPLSIVPLQLAVGR